MKEITKSAALIAAASGIVFGVLTPLSASAADASSALKWGACDGNRLDPRQQCATLKVPMDYARPDGPTVDLALSRIPAEKPSARRGALLLIPGGPGGSSLDDPSDKGQKLPQAVRNTYDLIGYAAARVGELAHEHRVLLRELTTQTASLETAFMELTADSVEYAAGETR